MTNSTYIELKENSKGILGTKGIFKVFMLYRFELLGLKLK
jgi:hypothetical protein